MESPRTLTDASALAIGNSLADRYVDRGVLGKGGMGEVRACEDRRIGREVALKLVRESEEESTRRARFVYEARIQARLEHPSIVPVYDIGLDDQGHPYFTMKRVRGVTLGSVLRMLRAGEEKAVREFTLRRLLTAFLSVCLAVEYAHANGVLHRDLKPANIMLGDFGELYVLDWGIARVSGVKDEFPKVPLPEHAATAAGDIVGTPGYIAPEHVYGQPMDARSDVYALGAILFEILTLEHLHPSSAAAALANTIDPAGVQAPSLRAPARDIPPELDAICLEALATDPAARFPSARALHDAVDGFLEGDRDLERRRAQSESHMHLAEELAQRAVSANDTDSEVRHRTRAASEVGRALALDPENAKARRLLVHLLTDPPRQLPPEVERELEEHHHAQRKHAARDGVVLYLVAIVYPPLALFWVGRVTWFFLVAFVLLALAVVTLFGISRSSADSAGRYRVGAVIATNMALGWLCGAAGPLLGMPTMVIANAAAFLMHADHGRRALILVLSCASLSVPMLLEWLGVVPPAYVIENGHMIVQNRVLDFTPGTYPFMNGLAILMVLGIGTFFIRLREALTHAERRLFLHAWQLRQLVPPEPDVRERDR